MTEAMRLVTTPASDRFDQAYATDILGVTRLAFLLVRSPRSWPMTAADVDVVSVDVASGGLELRRP